jgi:hypothetical protein
MGARGSIAAACVVALGVGAGCISNPLDVSAGGSLSMNMTNVQGSNLQVTSYAAKTIAGNYNSADHNLSDAGWSVVTGAPNALDTENQNCRGISLGFSGPPTAGTTLTVFDLTAPDGGGPPRFPDGGVIDTISAAVVAFTEGCVDKQQFSQWRATSGTVVIDSVGASPDGSGGKQVKLHYSGAAMAPLAGTQAIGGKGAGGTGQIDLFSGVP